MIRNELDAGKMLKLIHWVPNFMGLYYPALGLKLEKCSAEPN